MADRNDDITGNPMTALPNIEARGIVRYFDRTPNANWIEHERMDGTKVMVSRNDAYRWEALNQ